jgi:hypothetical protein
MAAEFVGRAVRWLNAEVARWLARGDASREHREFMSERFFELPSGAFRFELGLRRGEIAFFQNGSNDAPLLAERERWLAENSARYACASPGTEALLAEVASFAQTANPGLATAPDPAALGRAWAPDFLLLAPNAEGALVLRAGCVCFPSHWDLREKMGLPMTAIHAPVPMLNEALGRQVDGFLAALRPGVMWERWNWGFAATPERNDHPTRALPRLTAGTRIAGVWLRAEHQAFVRLPATGAILFGIRLVVDPLRAVLAAPGAAARMAHLLETMPEPIACYKGLATARGALLAELRGGAK